MNRRDLFKGLAVLPFVPREIVQTPPPEVPQKPPQVAPVEPVEPIPSHSGQPLGPGYLFPCGEIWADRLYPVIGAWMHIGGLRMGWTSWSGIALRVELRDDYDPGALLYEEDPIDWLVFRPLRDTSGNHDINLYDTRLVDWDETTCRFRAANGCIGHADMDPDRPTREITSFLTAEAGLFQYNRP